MPYSTEATIKIDSFNAETNAIPLKATSQNKTMIFIPFFTGIL